ncbi:MAG: S8 family serine peptidase, partial [Chloroflexota bacterium]|nr:S8 family serine peptidase [Chloroflexota bacterium]
YGTALDLVAPAGAGKLVDAGYGPADGVLAQTLKGGPSEFCFCSTASTSAAAAQVSGVAALLVGSRRLAGAAEIRAALLRGARDLGPRGRDLEHGAGLVQAARAVAPARAASGAAPSAPRAHRTPPSNPSLTLFLAAAAVAGLLAVLHVRRQRRRAA